MTDRETVANETAARALLPFLDDEARFGIEDLAKFSGIPTESLLDFWRALGFPSRARASNSSPTAMLKCCRPSSV